MEQGKILEATAARKKATGNATLRVEAIKRKYAGSLYTTESDRQNMITELRSELAAAVEPGAAAVFQAAIYELEGGTTKNSGTIDIPAF